MHQENKNKHIPVLLDHVLTYLNPQVGESYMDATAGYGGHANAILEKTHDASKMYLVDRDEHAIAALQPLALQGAHIIHTDFLHAAQQLVADQKQFDMVLADLGVSSPHLDSMQRGFSFREDASLDMRMDSRQKLTAEDIVNSYEEHELADVLWHYGEEPKARQIARAIVAARPIKTTQALAQIVASQWPGHSKIHPATRTFQAIRIVVNDELGLLEQALPLWIDLLKPGGRLAVISFHSLEDRIVKKIFAEYAQGYEGTVTILTKHPVTGSPDEIVSNPRARSAKLRAVCKK